MRPLIIPYTALVRVCWRKRDAGAHFPPR